MALRSRPFWPSSVAPQFCSEKRIHVGRYLRAPDRGRRVLGAACDASPHSDRQRSAPYCHRARPVLRATLLRTRLSLSQRPRSTSAIRVTPSSPTIRVTTFRAGICELLAVSFRPALSAIRVRGLFLRLGLSISAVLAFLLVQRTIREGRCGRICGSWSRRTMQKHALSCGLLDGHTRHPHGSVSRDGSIGYPFFLWAFATRRSWVRSPCGPPAFARRGRHELRLAGQSTCEGCPPEPWRRRTSVQPSLHLRDVDIRRDRTIVSGRTQRPETGRAETGRAEVGGP